MKLNNTSLLLNLSFLFYLRLYFTIQRKKKVKPFFKRNKDEGGKQSHRDGKCESLTQNY